MKLTVLSEIEEKISELSRDDKIKLIIDLTRSLKEDSNLPELENQLSLMANDSEIQKELQIINKEFEYTLLDGLENSL